MNKYQQEGYDAYVYGMLKHNKPSTTYALKMCPYVLGTDARKQWMKGWLKAREEA